MNKNTAQIISEIEIKKTELCVELSKSGHSAVANLIEFYTKQIHDIVIRHDNLELGGDI